MATTTTTTKLKDRLIELLEKHRGLVILFFCLPASFIFNLLLELRIYLYKTFFTSPQQHDKRVEKIQASIKKWNQTPKEQRKGKYLVNSRPNWLSLSTKFFNKKACHAIDISNLFDILELNEEQMTIRVEPMVTVGQVTKYLIPKGYTLEVTLEIEDATLGGLAMGTGMTTHSHKVGLYQETIVSYECLLSDGSFITCTKSKNSDLFNALPWSHGSLAFLVALTIKIIKIKPYVKLTYLPIKTGRKDYCETMRFLSTAESSADYLEMTVYSKNEAVIMIGNHSYLDKDETNCINHCTKWYKPWFYKYAEGFLKKGKHVEFIPLREYLLRHNRSIFWVVESMIPFGNNLIFRLLFGWLLPPKPAFLKFTTTKGIREYTFTKQVFQDIVLPINRLEEQMNKSDELFDIYPLLVYPCLIKKNNSTQGQGQIKSPGDEYLVEGRQHAMFNDLGIYGVPSFVKEKKPYDAVKAMREMEQFTREVGGFSFLYADIFMTFDEFKEMFDLTLYEQVRKKYKAEGAFPHLYEKVKPEIDVFKFQTLNSNLNSNAKTGRGRGNNDKKTN